MMPYHYYSPDNVVPVEQHIKSKYLSWEIFTGVLLVYLSFPTKNYYWDGIDFALAIESSSGLSGALIHPHHLLYNVFGYFIYHLVNAVGWHVRAVQALQVTNGILGALCASLLFRLLRHTLRSTYLSAILTVLFAFSATWWKYTTDADAYVPSVLFLLICFNLVLAAQKPRPFSLAVAHALSMCLHQLAVFFYPVIVLGLLLQSQQQSIKQRVLLVLKYSGTAASITLASYYYCFHLQTGKLDLATFGHWLTSYLHGSHSYSFSFDLWSNIIYTVRGHARLFFGGRLNWLEGMINPPVVALIAVLIIIVSLLGLKFIGGLKEIDWRGMKVPKPEGRDKPLAVVCSLWVGLYFVFLFFWYPYYPPYRMFYLPALICLAGIILARYEIPRTLKLKRCAAMFVAAVAISNFLFFIFPLSHVQKNPPLTLALEMNKAWSPGTVVYYTNSSADSELFRYFNSSTAWRQLGANESGTVEGELEEIYRSGNAAWVETSAIEQFQSSPEGARWLSEHSREGCRYELVNHSYRIRFIQIFPSVYNAAPQFADGSLRTAQANENSFQ